MVSALIRPCRVIVSPVECHATAVHHDLISPSVSILRQPVTAIAAKADNKKMYFFHCCLFKFLFVISFIKSNWRWNWTCSVCPGKTGKRLFLYQAFFTICVLVEILGAVQDIGNIQRIRFFVQQFLAQLEIKQCPGRFINVREPGHLRQGHPP